MKSHRFHVLGSFALALITAFAAPASAEDSNLPETVAEQAPPERLAPPSDPAWRFSVMPYVWASGMSGTIRPFTGAPEVSFSRSFSDVLDDLDAAFFLSFGAQKDRFVILGDASRVVTSKQGRLPNGLPAQGGMKQTTLTLAGGYRAYAEADLMVDVFAGVRSFRLEADVQVAGGAISASPQKNFTDPIIGGRATFLLSPRWSAIFYGDIGGFGVGSDTTVVISALFNYALSEQLFLSGGYRAMNIDYDDAGTKADITLQGPVLGASWRF